MLADWNLLSEHVQLIVTHAALRSAAETIACQAETLAKELELGTLPDRGGSDALRLLAALIGTAAEDPMMAGIVAANRDAGRPMVLQ